MAVKIMGQFAQPQESELSGLSAAIGSGLQAREASARTGIMQQEVNIRREGLGIQRQQVTNVKQRQENELRVKLAEGIREDEEKNTKYAYKLLEDTSMALSDKKPGELKMFWESDQGKSIAKVIKSYLPDYWDDKGGRPLTLSKENVVTNRLNKIKLGIVEKMGRGDRLSPGEQQQLDFFKQYSPQMIGAAVQAASNNLMWSGMSPKEQSDAIRQQLTMLKRVRRGMFEEEGTPAPKGGDATGGVSAESWLEGIGAGL